jgi:adenosine deaminase
MAKTVADDYLRRIPKAELHCHLAGTLRATTVAELAQRAGLALPTSSINGPISTAF